LLFAVFVLALTPAWAQPLAKQSEQGVYAVPFASEGNCIELEVVNSTGGELKDITVEIGAVPAWLTFEAPSEAIGVLKAGESRIAVFTFDQDERAPVGEVTELTFEVAAGAGHEISSQPERGISHLDKAEVRDDSHLETRTIRIQPEAPTELTLRGNYPNPFNPTTKIAYALPKDGNVQIEVFNAVGQRVTRLVDALQDAGYRETSWNATSFPSGVYFYSIVFDAERERSVKFGKMLLVK
jgi:hypothetical protein